MDLISSKPKKINLNYIISPTLNYEISEKISLQLNPQLLINSSSLIKYKDVNQRYSNWNLNLGVSYSL